MGKRVTRLFHAIRQVAEGKRLIKDEVKFKIVCLGAALIHLIFCLLTRSVNASVMYYYNIVIVIVYIVMGTWLNSLEKYGIILGILFFEIEAHSALASFMLGIDCEFMLYTVSLIPMAFYLTKTAVSKSGQTNCAVILSIFVMLAYLAVSIIHPPKAYYDLTPFGDIVTGIRYFNIFIAFFLQLSFSLLFALESDFMSGLLENENVKLSEDASIDPLTRLWNRRSLTNAVTEAIGTMERVDVFSVVMMDIDDFKAVNDTYGHDVGDDVLVKLAEIVKDEVRAGDYSCRWGGEEFLLFARGSRTDVQHVAERILERLRTTDFDGRNGTVFNVTMTAGVAEFRYGAQLRTVIEAADKRLYYGKTHGKNQVVSAS